MVVWSRVVQSRLNLGRYAAGCNDNEMPEPFAGVMIAASAESILQNYQSVDWS